MEEKVQETKKFNITDYATEVQEEIRQLMNIERFMKRIKDILGDEAFAYVEARNYLANRAALLSRSEEARLSAVKRVLEQQTVPNLVPVETKEDPEKKSE